MASNRIGTEGQQGPHRTIRIRAATHERLQALREQLARHGWRAFGFERADLPTTDTVVEAALGLLAGQARGEERR